MLDTDSVFFSVTDLDDPDLQMLATNSASSFRDVALHWKLQSWIGFSLNLQMLDTDLREIWFLEVPSLNLFFGLVDA